MENEALQAYRQRRAAFEATFERHLAAGVVFYSADGILIDDTVEIAPAATDAAGRIVLKDALRTLAARGVQRVFSEGGPRVAAGLIAEGLADEIVLFTAPKRLGRPGAPSFVGGARRALDDAARYEKIEDCFAGVDRVRRYQRVL